MDGGQTDYSDNLFNEVIEKVRGIEEKNNILKDRLMLIGQNLIEIKEENSMKILENKKDIDKIKEDIDRIKSFLESISGEFSRFAKKEDIEILSKQAKMFQPLEFVRRSELRME